MRIRTAWVVLLFLLAGPGVEAGLFGGGGLPKPVDHPIVRPKVKEYHKVGNHARHRDKYGHPGWGGLWKQIFRARPLRIGHYNKVR